MVVLDFKIPERWPRWLVLLFAAVTRPFGVTLDLGKRHPWDSIARHLGGYAFRTVYWGLSYLAVGIRVGGPRREALAAATTVGREAR